MHEVRALGPLAIVVLSLSTGLWHASWSVPLRQASDAVRVEAEHDGAWLEPSAANAGPTDERGGERVRQRTWVAMTRRRVGLGACASCSQEGAQRARRSTDGRDLRAAILRCRAKLRSDPDPSIA